MSAKTTVIIERGTFRIGFAHKNSAGEVVSKKPPEWTADPNGASVVVSDVDADGNPVGEADLFAAWDADGYEQAIRERLGIKRTNYPSIVELYKNAMKEDTDLCEFCDVSRDCSICPVKTYKDEQEEHHEQG